MLPCFNVRSGALIVWVFVRELGRSDAGGFASRSYQLVLPPAPTSSAAMFASRALQVLGGLSMKARVLCMVLLRPREERESRIPPHPHPWTPQEPEASVAVTPGKVGGPSSIPKREKENRVLSCASYIVGDVPNDLRRLHVTVRVVRTYMPTHQYSTHGYARRIALRRHSTPPKSPTGPKGLGSSWKRNLGGRTDEISTG